MDELLEPAYENEIGESSYQLDGGDDEIMAQVLHEQAVEWGEVVENSDDKDDEDDEDEGKELTLADMIEICIELRSGVLYVLWNVSLRSYKSLQAVVTLFCLCHICVTPCDIFTNA